jgi:hypothetical protein
MFAIRKFDHPSFGPCEIVPTIIAIRWARPLAPDAIRANLAARSLTLATESPPVKHQQQLPPQTAGTRRDPRAGQINQSEMLTWASGGGIDAAAVALAADDDVAWIAPVFRARKAEPGPQSYFTINPRVILLGGEAVAALDDLQALDASATVDDARGRLLKGFTVVDLPKGNAIELAAKLGAKLGASARGLKLENIPYLSPTTGCSSCGGGRGGGETGHGQRSGCRPATADRIPDDALYPQQWGLQRIGAPRAWPISEGDPNVVIAVLDQGVELGHPDLNLWPVSYSTITHTNDGSPVGNHGTPCAGIISCKIGNTSGPAGLAGKCRVMAIATNFADVEVAEGLYFAADHGARVVSMSFGVYPSWMVWDFSLIEAALAYCAQHEVVLVAATGNENQAVSRFPATDPTTIGVGGSNRADVRKEIGDTSIEPFWGACFGADVDVVAPCLEIPSTDRLGGSGYDPTDYTLFFDGTSAATPHVAALAGLVFSVDGSLSARDVRRIISTTTDKINQPKYGYAVTGGKPYGTWNNEVGYGRINVERALLLACGKREACGCDGPCAVTPPEPDPCCTSPCDPPWRPDHQSMFWYETRFIQRPLGENIARKARVYIEYRVTYEHRMELLGKQHGPLLYTQTLLPGEKVVIYHSDRYRQITSATERFSAQTTFMQFLSAVHSARTTETEDDLRQRLAESGTAVSTSVGGGLFGLFTGSSAGAGSRNATSDFASARATTVSDSFDQSVRQSSLLTHAERSVVVSTYEDKESLHVTARTLQNDNVCRAVTYFVRRVVELYALSTRVSDLSYRIVAPELADDWHSIDDTEWLPEEIRGLIREHRRMLPRVGDVSERPRPISLPTDGMVFDPELAHCCSCEPERAAAISIQLEQQKAVAWKACLEAQALELELERRKRLLARGELTPFVEAKLS